MDVGTLLDVAARGSKWAAVVDVKKSAKAVVVQKGGRHSLRKHQISDDGAEAGALLAVGSDGKRDVGVAFGECSRAGRVGNINATSVRLPEIAVIAPRKRGVADRAQME